jgi:hypothetical protein
MDGTATLGTATLNGSGRATYSSFILATGSHSFTAVYGGDSNFTGSNSDGSPVSLTVNSTGPLANVNPPAVQFLSPIQKTTSAPVPITLTNIGTAGLTISEHRAGWGKQRRLHHTVEQLPGVAEFVIAERLLQRQYHEYTSGRGDSHSHPDLDG